MDFDASAWDKRQAALQASFLQSGLWGAFQDEAGSKPHYLMEDGWSCLLLERQTPLGRYLFAPYGPTLKSAEHLETALKTLKNYGQQAGFDWLSLEPMVSGSSSSGLRGELSESGVRAAHNREPDLTRLIDLIPAEDDLLASISQSTRSFIRKNQRENFLRFKTSSNPADIGIFIQMLGLISRRKKVYFFSDEYFKKEGELLMPAGMMHLELALHNNKPVASALFHDYAKLSSYTFAASLPEARQTSASALLLWQSMLNAKQRGMQKMDLYGIAPDDAPPSHPWHGFTDFKKKFGGQIVQYAGTWDIPLSPRYRVYRTAQRARKLLRRC